MKVYLKRLKKHKHSCRVINGFMLRQVFFMSMPCGKKLENNSGAMPIVTEIEFYGRTIKVKFQTHACVKVLID